MQAPLVLLARLTVVYLDHRAHVAMVRKMDIRPLFVVSHQGLPKNSTRAGGHLPL